MEIQVLVACEEDLLREGICQVIRNQRTTGLVAQASDGRSALELAHAHEPAVAILSCSLPLLNGVEVARKINDELRTQSIIVARPESRHLLGPALAAGALGFVLSTCSAKELCDACAAVELGQTYISSTASNGQQESPAVHNIHQRAFTLLTPREREVVQLLAEGKTTKEMAAVLDVSARTIESHRYQIMSKLGIRSIAGLTKYALREGLTTL